MDLTPSEALAHARKWERQNRKITCMIVFPEPGMSIALNGRASVREGIIILTGYGGSSYSIPAETVTFSYVNEYLHISGLGWQCALWEPDDNAPNPCQLMIDSSKRNSRKVSPRRG